MKNITGHAAVVTLALILMMAGYAGEGLGYTWDDYEWITISTEGLSQGHSYALTKTAGTWQEAEAEAVALGGHLAEINDLYENMFLEYNVLAGDSYEFSRWIGLHWVREVWAWSSGAEVAYTNWMEELPDTRTGMNYVFMVTDFNNLEWHGRWANIDNSASYKGIIESSGSVVPLPSALLLLGLGLVRLAAWARRRA